MPKRHREWRVEEQAVCAALASRFSNKDSAFAKRLNHGTIKSIKARRHSRLTIGTRTRADWSRNSKDALNDILGARNEIPPAYRMVVPRFLPRRWNRWNRQF